MPPHCVALHIAACKQKGKHWYQRDYKGKSEVTAILKFYRSIWVLNFCSEFKTRVTV